MNNRQLGCLTGVAAATLLLSACGGGDDSSTGGDESPASTSSASPAPAASSATPSTSPSVSASDESRPSDATSGPAASDPATSPAAPSPDADQPTAASPTAAPDAADDPITPEAGPAGRSDRGYLVKEIGQPSYINDSSGTPAVTFVVTDVVADPVCSAPYAAAPENGHLVRVDVEVETGSAASLEELFYGDSYYFSASDWRFVDTEGVRANTTDTVASWSCLEPSEQLPIDIGPGERVTGSVVLDLPSTAGTLIYVQPLIDDGWEWRIG
ncbi:hypothetical protein NBM05_02940 [Rothia sp. AR01]|uniref:DUF4352 domain-containing protein n=1 Tax=Rothia santali TaxID=2949643 RepID=A0A9X2HHK6_9MICC|nr:hypothetical protein [Rothia santali]MCP3425013.1 hypothetical protein [Rothia santali]